MVFCKDFFTQVGKVRRPTGRGVHMNGEPCKGLIVSDALTIRKEGRTMEKFYLIQTDSRGYIVISTLGLAEQARKRPDGFATVIEAQREAEATFNVRLADNYALTEQLREAGTLRLHERAFVGRIARGNGEMSLLGRGAHAAFAVLEPCAHGTILADLCGLCKRAKVTA